MNKEKSLALLYTALSDEILATYQYWTALHSSRGEGKQDADPEYDAHFKEEWEHAEKIMERIKQLGGNPIPNPEDLKSFANPWTAISTRSVREQEKIFMIAELNASKFYKNALEQVKDSDPATHKIFKEILEQELEHLYDMKELFCSLTGYTFEDVDKLLEHAVGGKEVIASIEKDENLSLEDLKKEVEEAFSVSEEKDYANLPEENLEQARACFENLLKKISDWEDGHEELAAKEAQWLSETEVKISEILEVVEAAIEIFNYLKEDFSK